MFLYFAKLWNWKSVQQVTDTVPYVSTFCQLMKLANQFSRYWYCLLCLWITFFGNAKKIYVLASYGSEKSLQHITDTVPYVSEAGKSLQQITDTLSYVFTFCEVMKTGKSVQHITDTVPYVSTFCHLMKLGNQCSR